MSPTSAITSTPLPFVTTVAGVNILWYFSIIRMRALLLEVYDISLIHMMSQKVITV